MSKVNEDKKSENNSDSETIIPEGYYSEKEMEKFLGKTIATLRTDHCHRRNRVPPKTKLGRIIIYSKTSFSKWLESREIMPYEYKSKFTR